MSEIYEMCCKADCLNCCNLDEFLHGLGVSICLAYIDLNVEMFYFDIRCNFVSLSNLSLALFFEWSSYNFVRVNFTLSVAVLPVIC